MLRLFLSMCVLWIAAQAQAASPPNEPGRQLAAAQKALAAGDYARAWRAYAMHADQPLAQFTLGMFEREGWGRAADPAAACAWFDKAARGNIPAAQQFMGDCFAQGIGRPADGKAAAAWYRKAADAGIPYALCSAGELYLAGKIVPKDVERGIALCLEAAAADSVPAMLKLAQTWREGTLAPQDLKLARHWYGMAAQRRSHEAQFWFGMMLAEGQGGAADPSGARIWLERAAMEGHAPAYLPTAILYANAPLDPATGALTPDDLAKVYMWNSAARSRTDNPLQLAEIARIDGMVQAVMPAQWKPELDRRVAEHLAAHPAGQAR